MLLIKVVLPILYFMYNEKKNQTDSADFWKSNRILKFKFRHFLTTHVKVSESLGKKNLLPVDSCPQNSTTKVALLCMSWFSNLNIALHTG